MLESFQEKFNQIFHPPKSDDSFSFEEFDLQNPIMVCSKTFKNFYGMFLNTEEFVKIFKLKQFMFFNCIQFAKKQKLSM